MTDVNSLSNFWIWIFKYSVSITSFAVSFLTSVFIFHKNICISYIHYIHITQNIVLHIVCYRSVDEFIFHVVWTLLHASLTFITVELLFVTFSWFQFLLTFRWSHMSGMKSFLLTMFLFKALALIIVSSIAFFTFFFTKSIEFVQLFCWFFAISIFNSLFFGDFSVFLFEFHCYLYVHCIFSSFFF